ncbi:MAG: hypothetical protein JWP87_414 [Labilithrix sp.]|nr:hypothetical protein [Labilithrix sp.]
MLPVRRWFYALGACVAMGCGFDAVGGVVSSADPTYEGGADGSLSEVDSAIDGAAPDSAVDDADVDAAPIDAEADRPDAGGVTFVPSHIQPAYSLNAPNVTIASDCVVDTTARTIAIGAAAPAPLTNMVHSDAFAVWSVGTLTINAGVHLTVKGTRPLVVVSAGNVTIRGHIDAYGNTVAPGPGGSGAAAGPGKGESGKKPGTNDASGGGGAGHATLGGTGGTKGAVTGGAAGAITNANGATLIGGSGGGHGGGFGVAGACSDATRGRGGFGGGALQISAIGKIVVTISGGVDVGGGGGLGGCKNNGSDHYTGGGGGGAGGLVVLESLAGVQLDLGAVIAAAGGGGGEGGDSNKMGGDGESGPYPSGTASGGNLNAGGAGGSGGTGAATTAATPSAGFGGASAGGGGGSAGRVFLGARAPAVVSVGGDIRALRTDFAF